MRTLLPPSLFELAALEMPGQRTQAVSVHENDCQRSVVRSHFANCQLDTVLGAHRALAVARHEVEVLVRVDFPARTRRGLECVHAGHRAERHGAEQATENAHLSCSLHDVSPPPMYVRTVRPRIPVTTS